MQSFLSSFATDKTDDNDFEEGFSHSGNVNINSQDYPVDENSNNKVLSDNFSMDETINVSFEEEQKSEESSNNGSLYDDNGKLNEQQLEQINVEQFVGSLSEKEEESINFDYDYDQLCKDAEELSGYATINEIEIGSELEGMEIVNNDDFEISEDDIGSGLEGMEINNDNGFDPNSVSVSEEMQELEIKYNELLGKNTNSKVDTNEHSDKQKILNVFGDKEEESQTDCGDDNADDEVRFDPNSFAL